MWAYNVTTNAVVTNAGAAAGTPAATPGAAANPTVKQGQTIILPYTLGEFTAAKEADSKVI